MGKNRIAEVDEVRLDEACRIIRSLLLERNALFERSLTVIKGLLEILDHADPNSWSNGVTADGIDKGTTRTIEWINNLKKEYEELKETGV
jgi:hypothetical protein